MSKNWLGGANPSSVNGVRVGFAFSTKDRVVSSKRSLRSIDTADGFDLIWIDGSESETGRALPDSFHLQNARVIEVHRGVSGGADAAIKFGLQRLLALGYDYCGLIENDIVFTRGWLEKLMDLLNAGQSAGLQVGAVTCRTLASRTLSVHSSFAKLWNIGAGMVLFTREAAHIVLETYRPRTSLEISGYFEQNFGDDLRDVWELWMDKPDRDLGCDWGYALELHRRGLCSLGTIPTYSRNMDLRADVVFRSSYLTTRSRGHRGEARLERSTDVGLRQRWLQWKNTAAGRLRRLAGSVLRSTPFHFICGLVTFPSRALHRGSGDISTAKRILVLKPDEIGDMVLCTGFLKSLREQCPRAHITVAVREFCCDLVRNNGFADDLVLWRDSWRGPEIGPRAVISLMRSAYGRWHSAPPDWVLVPRGSGDHINAALYAWWTGSNRICAHSSFSKQWGIDRLALVTDSIEGEMNVHEIEYHRRMLSYLRLDSDRVMPRLNISASAHSEAAELRAKLGITSDFLALGVGAGFEDKRWPFENFESVVADLTKNYYDLQIVIVGGVREEALGERLSLRFNKNVFNAAGKLSLLGTAALLQLSGLFLGNDSGLVHIAAALGLPVIVVSKHPQAGSAKSHYSPQRFGPLAGWSKVLQPQPLAPECASECRRREPHCITNVQVSEVLQAIGEAPMHLGARH